MTRLGDDAMPSPIRQRGRAPETASATGLAEVLGDLLFMLLLGDAVVVVPAAVGDEEEIRRGRRVDGRGDARHAGVGDGSRRQSGVEVCVEGGVGRQLLCRQRATAETQ